VFAPTPLAGNGLAVVHDADNVDDATMLAFARETGLSETTFVQTAPAGSGADYVNRIFTVVEELPFAGHPSLGTAVAVAHARGERTASYVQRTPAGEQPVDVELDGLTARASMLQEPAAFGDEADPEVIAAASGLHVGDIATDPPPRFISTGVSHLIAILNDAAALQRIVRPDAETLARTLQGAGTCLYLAAPLQPPDRWQARSLFIGTDGVREDPATGSAAGPLCAYVARERGATSITIDQGAEMGRPSVLDARVQDDRIRVGGDVHVIATGTVHL
jgi:trans-2,3-dihydro-3-hydroxyanthranilate isomerase